MIAPNCPVNLRLSSERPCPFEQSLRVSASARLLAVLVLFAAAPAVRADEPPPSAAPPPSPTEAAIPVAQIPDRAERTDAVVRSIRARLAPDPTITAFEQNLPAAAARIEQLDNDSVGQLAAGLTPPALDDLRRQWRQIKDELTNWTQAIGARTRAVDEEVARLNDLDAAWAKTEEGARQNGFPKALLEPIHVARESIRATQVSLATQRDTLLGLLGHISTLQAQVSEAVAQLDVAEQQMRRDLFTADAPPLWKTLPALAHAEPVAAAVRAGLSRNRALLRAFLAQEPGRLLLHAVLLVLVLATTLRLSRRAEELPTDSVPPVVQAVLTRPISAALVLTLLLGAVLHPYAPVFIVSLFGVLAIAPMMRLFRGPTAPRMRLALVLVALLLLASTLRRCVPPFVPIARLVLLAESLGAMLSVFVIMRPARLAKVELTEIWRRWLGVAMWAMLAMLGSSVVTNLVGNVTLAILLTDGVLGAATAAIAFLTASRILEALLIQVVGSQTAERLRSIAGHARALRRRGTRVIRVLMVLAWFSITLKLFGLFTNFVEAANDALAGRLTVGAVSLSLADLLTVVLTLWVSFFIARVVRIVLEEDTLPRLSLPRGVPAAISVGVNYVILLIGFVFALSAAGVDPGRVTLVAGALGVGIGFGLQNIVNNFVSGIILLFERPIQIGDIISLGDVNGQVRRIGFRSSTIATFDGADVVVPNAFLVSERVVNWTLSNYQRRIELKLGVAYDNEPTAVIAVLEGAVKGIPETLDHPPPRAVLTGFGASSLDFTLWVWTDHQDMFATVRSNVAIAVYDALRAAGIDIPFPQSEIRVKPVAPVAPRSPASAEEKER